MNLQYLKKQESCHSCTLYQDSLFHQNVGVSSAGWCFEHTEKVKETKIWHGTIRMETICHMGATHCVFKQKKGRRFKKQKAKRQYLLVRKKTRDQGSPFSALPAKSVSSPSWLFKILSLSLIIPLLN